jgi:hypothetical protein
MTQARSLYFVAAAPILMAACAGPSNQTTQTTQLPGSPQQDRAVEAQEYRAQSYTLWDMADRRYAEAEVLSQQLGSNHEAVQQKFRLA